MKRCFRDAVGVAVVALVIGSFQAFGFEGYDDNTWIGESGGKWSNPDNWSLKHLPKEGETAFLPDADADYSIDVDCETSFGALYLDYHTSNSRELTVTLTGGGTLKSVGDKTNYVRTKCRLILADVSVEASAGLLNYGVLEIGENSSYVSSRGAYLWSRGASVELNGGEFSLSDPLIVSAVDCRFVQTAGRSSMNTDYDATKTVHLTMSIEGGSHEGFVHLADGSSLEVRGGESTGELKLSSGSLFSIEGGTWAASNDLSPSGDVPEGVVLNLTGGCLISKRNFLFTDRRWLGTAPDYTFMHVQHGSRVANFATAESPVVDVGATLSVTNGGLASTDGAVYRGEGAIYARNLLKESGGDCVVDVRRLVLGNADPTFDGNVFNTYVKNSRYVLRGPVEIGAFSDWVQRHVGDTSEVALDVSGALTVETTDAFDSTVGRTIVLNRINVRGPSSLAVRGIGTLKMSFDKGASAFDSVSLESGAAIDLSDSDLSRNGTMIAKSLSFAADSRVALVAGRAWLSAEEFVLTGVPEIIVSVPEDLAEGWYPVVQGPLGNTLPPALVSSVSMAGSSEGWTLVEREGALYVKKVAAQKIGGNDFEWVDGAKDGLWSSGANWALGKPFSWDDVPSATYPNPVLTFGPLGSGTVWYNTSRDSALQLFFDLKADSFVLKSRNTNGAANENRFITPSFNGVETSSGLYSLASTPQFVDFQIRVGSRMTWCAAGRGPLVQRNMFLPANASAKLMTVQGDVRFSGVNTTKPVWELSVRDPTLNAPFTRLTIMNNGQMNVSQQTRAIDFERVAATYPAPASSICVNKGGELHFLDDASGSLFYGWLRAPADCIVDGELTIDCVFKGGVNQAYRGEGTLTLSEVRSDTADSRVTVGGGLTLSVPRWTTVSTSDPNHALALAVEGEAVLDVGADFVYGPAAGCGAAVDASKRALEIRRGGRLTVDAKGHAVTIEDPIAGPGTLAADNGTFAFTGGGTKEGTLELGSRAVLNVTGTLSLGGFDGVSGASLRLSQGAKLVVGQGNVDLTGVELVLPEGCDTWQAIVVAENGRIAVPATEAIKTKVVTAGGSQTLYAKFPQGGLILLR